jgi:prepilin-type N-terminal cleavage/methylation domain-containing protein
MTIRPTNRRAFSMAEILVVVAILAVLASITLLAIGRAKKTADKTRLGYQLQIITQGLEAYQTDFNSLPVTSSYATATPPATDPRYYIDQDGVRGARLLCKALMGPCGAVNGTIPAVGGSFVLTKGHQDGKAGLGFAVPGRSGIAVTVDNAGNLKGKTYGPYLAADKFTISNTTAAGALASAIVTEAPTGEKYDDTAVLLDGNGNPILYYPVLNPQAAISVVDAYVGPGPTTATPSAILPTYRWSDNSAWIPETLLRSRLGDTNVDKMIGVGETAAVRGKYILWSSGPDGIFGPNNSANEKERRDVDDVTSFQGQ